MVVKIEDYKRTIKVTIGIVALSVGGIIYILYRTDSLLMFSWFQKLGMSEYICNFRADYGKNSVYGWVKYSMPAGLWLFSYLFIIDSVWGNYKKSVYKCFLCTLPIMAITSELLQYFGILSGTFDFLDLMSYISAIFLFIFIKKLQL